jgi:LemA protein
MTLYVGDGVWIFCGLCAVVVGVPLLWVVVLYNRFSRLVQLVRESWSGVDVELKRRHDLVPNLVETVKGYAKHERETLERVVAARARAISAGGAIEARVDGESELGRSLGRLLALSESYPELKSDRHFLELQRELSLTEDRIAASRRFFNANVRELNALRVEFPSNLVGGAFGFREMRYFELEDASERAAPRI